MQTPTSLFPCLRAPAGATGTRKGTDTWPMVGPPWKPCQLHHRRMREARKQYTDKFIPIHRVQQCTSTCLRTRDTSTGQHHHASAHAAPISYRRVIFLCDACRRRWPVPRAVAALQWGRLDVVEPATSSSSSWVNVLRTNATVASRHPAMMSHVYAL